MRPHICVRCKKNPAVIFITKIENGVSSNEGLCLKCAKELNIKPVQDVIAKLGLTDDDLQNLGDEMMEAMSAGEGLMEHGGDPDENDDGKTATFPFLHRLFNAAEANGMGPADMQRPPRGEKNDAQGSKKTKYLDTYCINLTQRARECRLDRMIGRETETERVIQILNRRQKNNPCLIGEPGVGKTAIAEGLAQRIAEGRVPYKLRDKEIYLMDLTSLVAGTQFRGQFEGRMKSLINEIKALGNM
ncbi:MAG: AAA family ATPase, partial [Oscillospiraceae bacterium]|nr:AAA family ATPase [Oscillospiraceae bacterium]